MSFKCQVTYPSIFRNINFRDGEIKTIEDLKKLISRVFRIDVSQFDIVNPPNEHQLLDMKGYDLKISIKKRCSNVQFRLPDGEIMYIQKCDKLTLDKVKEIIQKKGFKQDLKFSISGKDLLHIKYPFFAIMPDTIVDVQKTVIIQYVILDFGQRTFRFPDKTPVNIAYREISNEYKNLTEYNLISISNVANSQRFFGGERLKIEEKYSLTIICKYFFKIKTDSDYKMDQKFDFFAKIKDAKKRLSQALSCKKRNVIIYGKDSKEVQDDNLLLKDIRENEGTVYFNIFLKPKKVKKDKKDKRNKRDKKDKRKKPDKKYEHNKPPNKKNRDLEKREKSEESPRKQNKEDDKKLLSKSNRPKIKSALMKSLKQIPDSDSDENDKITKKSEIKTKNSKIKSDEQDSFSDEEENKNKLKNKQIQKKNQKRKFDLEEDNKSKNTKRKQEQKKKSNIEEDDDEEKTEKSVKIKFIFDENNEEIMQSFTKKVNINTTIEELDEEISDIYDIDTKILIQHKFKNNKMTIDRDMTIEDVLEDIKEGNSNILYIKITENPKTKSKSKSSSKPNKSSNRTKSNQKESKLEKQKIKSNKKTKQESESESDDDDDFDDYKKKDKSSKKTSKTIKKESETESDDDDDDDDFDDYKKKAKSPKKPSKTIKKESETESDDDDDYKKKAKSSKKSYKTIKKESKSESDDDDLDYYKKKAKSSKKPSKFIKKESESESDDHQKDDENEEEENDENNENEEEENNENEEEENNENEEEENNENEEDENDENEEDENDEDSESDDDDFDDVVVKPKQKPVNGKYKYYYQTNNDDEVKEIELKEGTNVKQFKEIIGKENEVENLADIKIIFAGKDLLNDIILDELNIGDTILFIYIRTIQDILLMTAKALQFKNEEEEEEEDD